MIQMEEDKNDRTYIVDGDITDLDGDYGDY